MSPEEKIGAAQKLIDEARAELTAMREKAAAPRNWPERIDAGMVFRHRGGAVYVWTHDRCQELVCIVAGGESRCGDVFDKDLARACMDSFAYLGHARDLIKIADDACEPTGAELVGNVCQVSLHPISEPNDGIRCLVTSFDPIIGYRTKEGENTPWKYARLAR